MFRFKPKHKKKQYELRSDDQSVQIPLTFHGKSVELNRQALGKGEYTLCSGDKDHQSNRIPVVAL